MTDTVRPYEGAMCRDRVGYIRGPMKRVEHGWIAGSGRVDPSDEFDWFDNGGYSPNFSNHDFDLVAYVGNIDVKGNEIAEALNPIKTSTRIEEGTYGRLVIEPAAGAAVYLELTENETRVFHAVEIRDLIKTLTAIADHLEKLK